MPKLTRAFKGKVLAVHRLDDGRITVGRDTDCDIQVDSLAIAPHHVELMTTGESCQLRALDPGYPVYVNEHKVDAASLNHGDILHIGKHSLTFAKDGVALSVRMDAANAVYVNAPKDEDTEAEKVKKNHIAYMQIRSGEHIGRIIRLNQPMVQLGKAGGNCVIITHRRDGYYISCLDGTNVTVGGLPIDKESVLLRDGNLIQIGAIRFQFYS